MTGLNTGLVLKRLSKIILISWTVFFVSSASWLIWMSGLFSLWPWTEILGLDGLPLEPTPSDYVAYINIDTVILNMITVFGSVLAVTSGIGFIWVTITKNYNWRWVVNLILGIIVFIIMVYFF